MWGLALSVLTIAVSMVTGDKESSQQRNGSGVRQQPHPALVVLGMFNTGNAFVSGAVVGVGSTLLLQSLLRRFRVWEHLRCAAHALWRQRVAQDDDENESTSMIRPLVTPQTAPTSTLTTCVLTIPPGRELTRSRSTGVECYYVVAGEGRFMMHNNMATDHNHHQSSDKATTIRAGDSVVVPPRCWRQIVAPAKNNDSKDLVLVRGTDDGGRRHPDTIVATTTTTNGMIGGNGSTTMDQIQENLRHVQSVALDFVTQSLATATQGFS